MKKRIFKRERIKSNRDFGYLLKRGKRWKSREYNIIYKNNHIGYDRFGIIVTKKDGNSVQRNRKKRLFRETYRLGKKSEPPFFDIIFKPHHNKKKLRQKDISEEFRSWIKYIKK